MNPLSRAASIAVIAYPTGMTCPFPRFIFRKSIAEKRASSMIFLASVSRFQIQERQDGGD
jgi:hypothetical protein